MQVVNKEGEEFTVPGCIQLPGEFSGLPVCRKARTCDEKGVGRCGWKKKGVRSQDLGRTDTRHPSHVGSRY